MANPVPGRSITTLYKKRGKFWGCDKNAAGEGVHTGVDYAAPAGTKAVAAIAGQIRHRNYGAAFGKHQFAISPDGDQPFAEDEVFYAHTRTRLPDGTRVEVGDFVAEIGDEGNVTGPHLHFEYHKGKQAWNCGVHRDPRPVIEHGASAAMTTDIYSDKLGYGEPSNGDAFSDSIKELQARLNDIPLPAPGNVTLLIDGVYSDATDTVVRAWQKSIGNSPDAAQKSYLGPSQRALMFPSPPYTVHDRGLPAVATGGGTITPPPPPSEPSVLGQWLKEQGFIVHDADAPLGRESTWDSVKFLMVHHTGSPDANSFVSDVAWIRKGNADAPLAQLYIDHAGDVWVCCRERDGQPDPGRASHAGAGAGFGVPDDKMNEVSLGIECKGDGSRPLSDYPVMYEVLIRLLAALSTRYSVPEGNIIGHKEWSSTGKKDPIDSMNVIRAAVHDQLGGGETDPGEPEVPVDPEVPGVSGQIKVTTVGGDEVLVSDATAVHAWVENAWVQLVLPGEPVEPPLPPEVINYHEVVQPGGDVQAAMNRARDWYVANRPGPVNFDDPATMATVELAAGVHERSASLFYRRGVRLLLSSAIIRKTGDTSNLFVNDNNGGGGYNSPNFDWSIVGGTLDGGGLGGGISTVHVKRFRLDGVTITNVGAKKHMLEINSSGGPRQDGVFTCEVLRCQFFQTKKATSARAEDEAIQFDYSWPGAAPNTANDGTVTNNVLIEGCQFHDIPRAIGSHHWQKEAATAASPKGFHANIVIRGNKLWDIDPTDTGWGDGANGANSEGAIRAYAWTNVTIEDNELLRCYQPINLYIPSDAMTSHGNPGQFFVRRNLIKDKTSARAGILGDSARVELRFDAVMIEENRFEGSWGGTTYAIAVNESTGKVPGHTEGAVILNNLFKPTNMTLAQEKAYNKYRAQNTANLTGVLIKDNAVSDGTIDNS
jgi:hypothetical protein